MSIIYFNGRYMEPDRARVPASDPALSWGVGLFEVVRGYNRRAFLLEEHLERLHRSADHFGIDAELPDLAPVVSRLFERNGLDGGYVRITLTGGGNLIVAVNAWKPPPKSRYSRGGQLLIAPFRRDSRAPLSGHKTLNYLENMQTRWEAESRGVIDALVLGFRDEVLEGTRCNVFAVREGRVMTAPLSQGILPGITRQLTLRLAREDGIDVREKLFKLHSLLSADEVFITSTMMEVVPIVRIGEAPIPGPGHVTRRLMRAYRACVARSCPEDD